MGVERKPDIVDDIKVSAKTGLPARKSPTTLAQVKSALRVSKGYISVAAMRLHMTPRNLRIRIERNESLQELLRDIRDKRLDNYEKRLEELTRSRDAKVALGATTYALDRLGKERGYGKEGDDEIGKAPITIVVRRFSNAPTPLPKAEMRDSTTDEDIVDLTPIDDGVPQYKQ